MKKLYEKIMIWYWMRYYRRKFLENPHDPELVDMALRAGSIREYKQYLKGLKK